MLTPTQANPTVRLILRWLIAAAAVWAAATFVPGIRYGGGFQTLLVVALVMGLVNALVRPIVKSLACGLIVLTLGLALFIINALMLLLTGWIADQIGLDFHVDGFWTAVWGSIVISIASAIFGAVLDD